MGVKPMTSSYLLSRPANLDLLLVQVEVEEAGDALDVAALAEEGLSKVRARFIDHLTTGALATEWGLNY